MKSRQLFSLYVGLTAILMFGMTGCKTEGDSEPLVNAVKKEVALNDGTLITSLTIVQTDTRLRVGESFQLTAEGTDINGNKRDVTKEVSWKSGDTTTATVNDSGLITAVAYKEDNQGFIDITATTFDGTITTGRVSVKQVAVTHIDISQKSPATGDSVYTCIDTQFQAKVIYEDGIENTIIDRISWSVSGSNTALMESNGILRTSSASQENLTVSGMLYGTTGEKPVTTDPAQLISMIVTDDKDKSDPFSINVGSRIKFKSIGNLNPTTSTTHYNVTQNANWLVKNAELAGITTQGSLKGSLLALKPGETVVEVNCGSKAKTFSTLKISGESQYDSLKINSGDENLTLKAGESAELKLLIKYKNYTSTTNISEFAAWEVDNNSLLTGQLINHGADNANFKITAGQSTGSAKVIAVYDNTTVSLTVTMTN